MNKAEQTFLSALSNEFYKIRERNPAFSHRAYAKKLGISPATLCGILRKKLPITRKTAEKALTALNLPMERYVRQLRALKFRSDSQRVHEDQYLDLDMDYFHLISEWYCFAILELIETDDFQSDPEFIARRLGIAVRAVEEALRRLKSLGIIEISSKGKISSTGRSYKTSSGVPNLYVRKNNQQGLELALQNMQKSQFFETSDYSAVTMAIDPKKIPAAKKKIAAFRRSLCAFLESGRRKEVFRLNLELFPLTNFNPPKEAEV